MKINTNSMKKQYEELLNTFCKKNHDYGNSFELSLDKYGLVAGVVRMEDKMNRLSTLVYSDTDAQIASESLVDTLMDLSNYAAMSACWLMGQYDETSDEGLKNTLHLASFEGHQEKVNERAYYERAYYERDHVSDEEIIKNWGLVGDSKAVRSRTTGQYLVEDDNPELFRKIYGVLKAYNGYASFKKIKDKLTGTDEEFRGRFNDLKETVFEQINRSRVVATTDGVKNDTSKNKEDEQNKQSIKQWMRKLDFKNHKEQQQFSTELKGLENGYFIRQHINSYNPHRYTIAFNPEGTIKTQNGEEKPYIIECFSYDKGDSNTWALHVFDTREDMVAALNYDLKVSSSNESMNFRDSIKGLDIKVSVFSDFTLEVLETWVDTFGLAFDNNMKCKNLFSDGLFGISQGIKTFGPVFISEKTGALVVKGLIRERFSDRNHNFIWFSDTKEVLLEIKNTVPKFNHHGIIYGINSENVNNGENYDFNPLYQDMEDHILSKFNSWHAWSGSELKNLVFFNEDEELNS